MNAAALPAPMANIKIGRYAHPETHGWSGWVEPETKDWIVFVHSSGAVEAYLDRAPDGAIVCPTHGPECTFGKPWEGDRSNVEELPRTES